MLSNKPIIVLLGGGHRAGKRTCASEIAKGLTGHSNPDVQIIDMNRYLTSSSAVEPAQRVIALPSRFDFAGLVRDLERTDRSLDVILVHGLYALYTKELRDLASMKIFVDSDPDTRLTRWIQQDVLDGGEPLDRVLNQYLNFARPEMTEFIIPTKEFADLVLPRGAEEIGIRFVVDGVEPLLQKRHNVIGITREDLITPLRAPHALGVSGLAHIDFKNEALDREKERYHELN